MKKKNTNYNEKNHKTNNHQKKFSTLFPPPSMLESYEEIFPGFTKELKGLVKREQEERRAWINNYFKLVNSSIKFGQFLAFLFSIIILIASLYLLKNNNASIASMLFITWFIFLFLMNAKVKKSNHQERGRS